MRNPFKHRHDTEGICHCKQMVCYGCGKHLWQIIRDSPKRMNEVTKEAFFEINKGEWLSISLLKDHCVQNKLRFYTEELGEVETGWRNNNEQKI